MAIKPVELIIKARDEASGVLGTLQGKLTAVAATIAAYFGVTAFVGAVKGAADLEAGMSRVLAATGASTDEMKLLRQAAEDAGANSKYTSTEAAGALENLAKAGLSAKDAIAALPAVLNLAQAGDIELGTASEYLTKAVMGMGLAFTDAGRVADVLAMGANATNTSVTGLAQALSYVAPIANTLGVSLESTVAIVGKFADAGIDASRAGTALNSIMSQFADPASKFRQELGAAGITTNNFEAALHQLAKAGPSGAKAINAVGLEAGPALRALLNQGMGALDDLTVKLKSAEGSAAAAAKVMQENLKGSISSLSSAWDTLKNALATPVLPVLKDGVDQLAGALRSAVTDGTIAKFGDAIATGFQSGIKWAREFIGTVNFTQVTADLRAFADRSGEVFTQIGEYATNAGNMVKLGYGVMSAGTNAVLTGIYGIGSGFATVASTIMSGVAILRDALAKVTFGGLSDSFKLAAEDARSAAQGFGDAAQAMRDKAAQALGATAGSAQLAGDGFTGLTKAITDGKPAIDGTSSAMASMVKELAAGAEAAAAAGAAYQRKANAEQIAKQSTDEHAIAVRKLKDEYEAAVSTENWQLAAEKIKELKKATDEAQVGVTDLRKKVEDDAKLLSAAFAELGLKSRGELQNIAKNAVDAFEVIKKAGQAEGESYESWQARKAQAAQVMLSRMIEANSGVADAAIKTRAAMEGLEVQVDSAGKSIVKAMGQGSDATRSFGGEVRVVTEDLKAQAAAIDAINAKYGQSIKDRKGRYDAPNGESVVDTSGGDRAKFLNGQNAVDNTLQFKLLDKSQKGTLTAADVDDAKRYLAAQRQQNQINRDLDKFGGGFSAAGAADRNKWQQFEAVMQNFVDSETRRAPAAGAAENQRQAAGAGAGETVQQANQRQAPDTQALIANYEQQLRDAKTRNDPGDIADLKADIAELKRSAPTTAVHITLDRGPQTVNTDAAGARVLQDLLSQLGNAKSTSSLR